MFLLFYHRYLDELRTETRTHAVAFWICQCCGAGADILRAATEPVPEPTFTTFKSAASFRKA